MKRRTCHKSLGLALSFVLFFGCSSKTTNRQATCLQTSFNAEVSDQAKADFLAQQVEDSMYVIPGGLLMINNSSKEYCHFAMSYSGLGSETGYSFLGGNCFKEAVLNQKVDLGKNMKIFAPTHVHAQHKNRPGIYLSSNMKYDVNEVEKAVRDIDDVGFDGTTARNAQDLKELIKMALSQALVADPSMGHDCDDNADQYCFSASDLRMLSFSHKKNMELAAAFTNLSRFNFVSPDHIKLLESLENQRRLIAVFRSLDILVTNKSSLFDCQLDTCDLESKRLEQIKELLNDAIKKFGLSDPFGKDEIEDYFKGKKAASQKVQELTIKYYETQHALSKFVKKALERPDAEIFLLANLGNPTSQGEAFQYVAIRSKVKPEIKVVSVRVPDSLRVQVDKNNKDDGETSIERITLRYQNASDLHDLISLDPEDAGAILYIKDVGPIAVLGSVGLQGATGSRLTGGTVPQGRPLLKLIEADPNTEASQILPKAGLKPEELRTMTSTAHVDSDSQDHESETDVLDDSEPDINSGSTTGVMADSQDKSNIGTPVPSKKSASTTSTIFPSEGASGQFDPDEYTYPTSDGSSSYTGSNPNSDLSQNESSKKGGCR